MQQYAIHPLAVGINETDQGVMTYLRDYGKRIYFYHCMIRVLEVGKRFRKIRCQVSVFRCQP